MARFLAVETGLISITGLGLVVMTRRRMLGLMLISEGHAMR